MFWTKFSQKAYFRSDYIKLFRTGANRHKGILMSLLLLAVETITCEFTDIISSVSFPERRQRQIWRFIRLMYPLNNEDKY